ncbi:MAG: bile acid:sodium symporter [Chloroflexi bacterium]|nr:bile acid:sodium symporter [Chloroflexota bacterium]
MQVITALLNIVLPVFIVSTMLAAGLGTTVAALRETMGQVGLIILVLVVNLVLVPLVGWATAAALSLATPASIALILLACSPGAPFGAKLAMIQRGDVITGSSLQVLLAAIGSVTFAPTANAIFTAAKLGGGISLPVGNLVLTVAVLQLLPFAIGLALRTWAPETAAHWEPPTLRVSNLTFVAVLAFSLLGSWQQIVALIGSLTMLASIVFAVVTIVLGTVVAIGSTVTRTTVGFLASTRNAGPVFAAVAIAFNNNPNILGAVTGLLLPGLVVAVPLASYLAKRRTATEEVSGVAGKGREETGEQPQLNV